MQGALIGLFYFTNGLYSLLATLLVVSFGAPRSLKYSYPSCGFGYFLSNAATGHSYCYSLGMVKMEAYDDSHFMHQAVRVGHTDHTGSIVFPMACIFDLKENFLCTGQ